MRLLNRSCSRPAKRRSVVGQRERGAELVEFAMVLPVLLLLLFAVADIGFMLRAYGVVNNAAREGARLAIMEAAGYTPSVVQSRVAGYISESIPGGATPTTTVEPLDVTVVTDGLTLTVHTKRVTVIYPFTYRFVGGIAGLFGGSFGTVNLRAVVVMRTESPAE